MNIDWRSEWYKYREPAVAAFVGFSVGVTAGYALCKRRTHKIVDEVVDEIVKDETENQLKLDFLRAAEQQVVVRDAQESTTMEADFTTHHPPFSGFTTVRNLHTGDFRDLKAPIPVKDGETGDVIGRVNKIVNTDEGIMVEGTVHPSNPFFETYKAVSKAQERGVELVPEPELETAEEFVSDSWEERSKDNPWIMHEDEFHNSTTGFTQVALTWFPEDEILADDKMQPIPNVNKFAGRLEFGRGSSDDDMVYITNPKLELEMEITRIPGASYTQEMYGVTAEEEAENQDLKHSQKVPKFRPY